MSLSRAALASSDTAVRILVLRTGQAVNRVHVACGAFSQMFTRGLNGGPGKPAIGGHVAVDELDVTVRAEDDPLPTLERYDGVIMTGSPAYVGDDEPWMRWGARVLLSLIERDLPLLCVCFGHQLLGKALGADVGPNPNGLEMGTVPVQLGAVSDDLLFGGLAGRFDAQCTHRDVIRRPSGALTVLASTPHDGCAAVRAGRRAWGLQFHPEFDDVVMRLYLEARRELLEAERGPGAYAERLERVRQTPIAASLLHRFAALCRDRSMSIAPSTRAAAQGM